MGLFKKRDEFRKNKNTGHPAYIFGQERHSFLFFGITHKPKTNNQKNVPLKSNPNPKDKRQAFVRPAKQEDKVNHFSKPMKGWKLSKKDKQTINNLKNK